MNPLLGFALGLFSLGLVLAAAWHDLLARTVPNRLPVLLALVGLARLGAGGDLWAGLAAGGLVFAAAAWCWRRGWLGGGDVKLLAACALSVPPHLVPELLAAIAIAGAGLALIYLAARRWVRPAGGARPAGLLARAVRAERWRIARGGPLPYAVAIAIGSLAVLPPATPPARLAALAGDAAPIALWQAPPRVDGPGPRAAGSFRGGTAA